MQAQFKTYMTPEEYLRQEREAPFKSEYYAGEVFAMAGASPRHTLIVANTVYRFVGQLKGRACTVHPNDLRVKVIPAGLYTYPDIVVVCGTPRYEDRQKDTLLNPNVLVEVLSDSTEAFDRGQKFAMYRALKSLTDYLLIAQNQAMIEHFVRRPNGQWMLSDYRGTEAIVTLASIGCTLPLADIYDKVEFDEETAFPKLRLIKEPEVEYVTETRLRRPGDPRPDTRVTGHGFPRCNCYRRRDQRRRLSLLSRPRGAEARRRRTAAGPGRPDHLALDGGYACPVRRAGKHGDDAREHRLLRALCREHRLAGLYDWPAPAGLPLPDHRARWAAAIPPAGRSQHELGLTDVEFLTGDEVRQRFPYAQAEEITAGTFRQRDGWISAHEACFGFARAPRRPSCSKPPSRPFWSNTAV